MLKYELISMSYFGHGVMKLSYNLIIMVVTPHTHTHTFNNWVLNSTDLCTNKKSILLLVNLKMYFRKV